MIRLLRIVLTAFSKLLNLLPQRFVLLLGDGVGWIWFYVIPIRRATVLENLKLVLSDRYSEAERWKIARRNYCHYGRCLFEIFQSISWGAEEYRRRVIVEGLENAAQFYREGRGGYFLTCHLGNWELLVGSGAAHGIPVDIVVKYARNPTAEALLQWYRDRLGVGVLLESGTAKDILRSISRGRFIGFILDQFMGPPIGLPIQFFGKLAGTTVSLALLTEKRDVPILPAYSYRDERGRLHTVIEPALKFPKFSDDKDERLFQKTQFFNDVIEEKVRMHPEQWLWLHRRWKEYRGVPRWNPKSTLLPSLSALLLGIFLVSGNGQAAETGIALPPDQKLSIPEYETADQAESRVVIDETGRPASVAAPDAKKKKDKKESPSKIQIVTTDRIPFEIGERLELDLGWMALTAGRAVIEVRKGEPFQNRPTYWLWGNVLSNRIVDAIYHVDNTIQSFVDASAIVPHKFQLSMVESPQLKETKVGFDHVKKKAFYWAKRVSPKYGDETQDRVDDYIPAARDMFSALYYARTLDYALNQKQNFSIYENGKNWEVELLPVANELVNSKVGAFQCWKILVRVKLANVLSPTGDIYMWLSDDSKKYIVKFEAKVKIGSLWGSLTSIRAKQ